MHDEIHAFVLDFIIGKPSEQRAHILEHKRSQLKQIEIVRRTKSLIWRRQRAAAAVAAAEHVEMYPLRACGRLEAYGLALFSNLLLIY
ncbi:unnamed protein product [Nippostrongylus brasiliensis]|uniref:Uncharacterized protein n=1 Tax=Nippostrongylus brasiliensis TaxID=27835 RepID=A0A0N4XIK8_NIPBR|nr:unnamed protein product [Nippostrongylus brasiliensis]